MALKDLFGKKSGKVVSATTIEEAGNEAESPRYIKSVVEERKRYVPDVDFTEPSNFVRFGSAKRYYEDAVKNVYKTYPYDGSEYERQDWRNNNIDFDNYIFDNDYPRTTGYINLGYSYGTTSTTEDNYDDTNSNEFIHLKGGPHASVESRYKNLFDTSNKYETDKNRKSNLELNGTAGNTIEFFFKKDNDSGSPKQVIFDLWNSASFGTEAYGRFRVEIHPGISGEEDKMYLEIMSGTSGIFLEEIGSGLNLTGSTWNHYAISTISTGSQLSCKLYVTGTLNDSILTGSSIGLVTGSMLGWIGSLGTQVSGAHAALGWGKLSGSLDEFRYWKTKRTDKAISRNWFTQVGGGTNTDVANTTLGVYYKFNEGIYNTSSTDTAYDPTILDYSGRITNGVWTGYTLGARSTGSAITESSASAAEFQDPIIYATHPLVLETFNSKSVAGELYDRENASSLYNSFPSWITEEDQESGLALEELTQIMSSFFDDMHLKIEMLPKIKEAVYRTENPLPFAAQLLESVGFTAPDLFTDASLLEAFMSRDEERNFAEKIHDVKNHIYQNIYNNLAYIYRSKGTEKSIRNLIRCFGIDSELLRVNMYADNAEYDFTNRYEYTSIKKKYVDFNDADRFDSTVYQMTASNNANSVSFISGSANSGLAGTTYEAEVLFPKKFQKGNAFYFTTDFITASLFGMHEANRATPENTTWRTGDRSHLGVYAIRDEEDSNHVRFRLTSSYLGVNLETETYKDVYNNEKWNFAVRLRNSKYPFAEGTEGTTGSTYTLEFHGVNAAGDYAANEFTLTSSIANSASVGHLESDKRIYVGAHRTNFTGSLVVGAGNTDEFSDAKISSVRYWLSYLPEDTIREHARDPSSFGADKTYRSDSFLNIDFIPKMETLALHWDFAQVTGSDNGSGLPPSNLSDAGFLVEDASSGSVNHSRYGELGAIVRNQHTGKGDFFLRNNDQVVQNEYVFGARHRLPETITNSDMTKILTQDDTTFTRDTIPVNHVFAIEKGMHQTISQEMIKHLGTLKDFNNLIGEPINRYRQKYKALEKVRNLFFEGVSNEPDLERYVEFYKWIDSSVNSMIMQLIPASAVFSEDTGVVVESHMFERNKYWNKYPSLEIASDVPTSGIRGINELKYDWKHGHAPVPYDPTDQSNNCFWWRQRWERQNSDRDGILSSSLQILNREYTTPYDLGVDIVTVMNRDPKRNDYVKNEMKFGSDRYLSIDVNNYVFDDCDDDIEQD